MMPVCITCLESVSVSAGQADRSERVYAVHNVARICDQSRTYDVLSLPSNGIGAEGAQGLVPLLELGTSLRTLNLRFCDIDAAGCAALSEGVGRSAALAELHLFGNHIGDAGAQALGAALGSCASLTRLNLGCCKIGPAGCRALCEGVLSNAAIVDLSLMNNCFGDAGVRDLATMLSEHGAMTRVDLTANSISEHGATLLLQAVQRGPKRLSPLELRGVSLSNAATAVGLVGTGGGSDNASILSALNDRCSADNSLAMRLGWH